MINRFFLQTPNSKLRTNNCRLPMLLLGVFLFVSSPIRAAVVDRVAAVVNDEIITGAEVEEALAPLAVQCREKYQGEELEKALVSARQEALDQLIEEKLILGEAKAKDVTCSREDVEDRIARIRENFSSPEEFAQALATEGITEDRLREKVKQQLIVERVLEQEVKQRIIITPGEVSDYYRAHREEFLVPEAVRLSLILITEKNADRVPEAKAQAEDIYRQLGENGNFTELARQYSRHPSAESGGDMGFVTRGQMRPEIEQVIFALAPGAVSPPIEIKTDDWQGFYVCRVEEKRPEKVKDLTEVQAFVRRAIFQEKIEKEIPIWIAKLKKTAYVSVR